MVFTHMLVSAAALLYAAFIFFRPSWRRIAITYTLLTLTVLSGLFLGFTGGLPIARTCIVGIAYVCLMAIIIHFAEAKLSGKTKKRENAPELPCPSDKA